MERFAIKIDKKLKANLYKICRLCGMDNPEMVPIITDKPADKDENVCIDVEAELEMQQKINLLLGLTITKDDRMPQTMCCLCVDKINDFYEFREMCYATHVQTRKLLGLKNIKKPALDIKPKIEIKEESIVPTPITTPSPEPASTTAPAAPTLSKNKKRKSEEVAPKEEKPDIATAQQKKKLRFSIPAESIKEEAPLLSKKKQAATTGPTVKEEAPVNTKKKQAATTTASTVKEEAPVQIKKKLRFSATIEEPAQTPSNSSKKSKLINPVEDSKLKKEPSPPVPAPVPPPAVSNKKLRLAAPPQKELALKKSKQKTSKNIEQKESDVKDEIKDEVKEEPATTAANPSKLPPSKSLVKTPLIKPLVAKAPPAKVLPNPAKVPPPPKLKFGCNICKERFPAKVNLETHRATHVPKVERYVCTACNETLSKSFDIKNHQLWHKLSKTPYVCGCCGESILNTYAFSRHLREHAFDTPPALLVLDRECPLCHTSYATNYLYNIHVCAVKARRCAGCNRVQRNDSEYLKHSAQCAKVYLNYSKHIMPSVEALEDSVRIKNENDVEAAAEEMARISGVSLDMAPVVQLTRLSSPLILAASQAVSATGLDDTASTTNKKSGKKGVSKKAFKRVDELLKSTLDALVSIKHEPEVHVDQETPCAGEHSDNEDRLDTDDHDGGLDDFHHNDETDNENEETEDTDNVANANESNSTAGVDQIKIKQEIDDTNEENANKVGGGLKLKIKKEHGQLNSSIIEQQKSSEKRAEKRKKKKKHKEKEKDKQKLSKDMHSEQDANINNASSEENVETSAVRIKVEPQDGSDFTEKSLPPVLQQRPQPEATIMTSIPMMQFQIACVSSGVEFNNTTNAAVESHQTLSSTNNDVEPEDVKPNRQELDRMLKISHVSGGIAMEADEAGENVSEEMDHDGNCDRSSVGEEEEDYPEGEKRHVDEDETDFEEDNPSESPEDAHKEFDNEIENNEDRTDKDTNASRNKIVAKNVKKSLLQTKPKLALKPKDKTVTVTPKSRNKACKSTAKPPNVSTLQISAVQSGVALEPTTPTTSDFTPIFIKPEPQNRGYSDEQPEIAAPASPSEPVDEESEESENLAHAHTAEEQNYISTIDFSNITIKQEKDIEINDVQLTQKSVKSIAKVNGLKRKRKQVKDKSLEQKQRLENNDDCVEEEEEEVEEEEQATDEDIDDNESEDVEEEEEDVDEDEEDYEEMDEEDESEEREYRELEYPPELPQEKDEPETASKELVKDNENDPSNEKHLDTLNEVNNGTLKENDHDILNEESDLINSDNKKLSNVENEDLLDEENHEPFNEEDQDAMNEDNNDLLHKHTENLSNEEGEDSKSVTQETFIEENAKVSFVIANVCSQVSIDNSEENFAKISREAAEFDQVSELTDSNILKKVLTPSNVSASNDLISTAQSFEQNALPGTSSSDEKFDIFPSSSVDTLNEIKIAEENPSIEVPNIAGLQTGLQAPLNANESQKENTLDVNTAALISQEVKTEIFSQEMPLQLGEPFEINTDDQTKDVANNCQGAGYSDEAYTQVRYAAQLSENYSEQSTTAEAQNQPLIDHITEDIQHVTEIKQQDEKSVQDVELNQEAGSQETPLLHISSACTLDPSDQLQHKLHNTIEQHDEILTTSEALLDNPTYTESLIPPQTEFDINSSKVDLCLQSNDDACEVAQDPQETEDSLTMEGIVEQSKDAHLEAHPGPEYLDNDIVHNDEEDSNEYEDDNELEDDVENDEESTLGNNLEEQQNYQNQEVLSQLRPTALALHPYLEDISSSSNSILSNSLSQTPPPPLHLATSATGVNNELKSQRLLNIEETENILNESNEVAETSAVSVSRPLLQPILGQQLPPQMPTFNFDNINEIAENNNNANIEREQLQDEQHQHQQN